MRTIRARNSKWPSGVSELSARISGSCNIAVLKLYSSLEHPLWLALPHRLLAIGVQCIVDDPLGGVDLVIVFVTQVAESFGNRFESWAFWLLPERIVGVRAVDDLAEQGQRRVSR